MCQNYGGFLFLLDALASSLHILAPPSQDHRDGERKRCKKGTRNCRKEKLQLRCISLELRQVHIMCCTAGSHVKPNSTNVHAVYRSLDE